VLLKKRPENLKKRKSPELFYHQRTGKNPLSTFAAGTLKFF
jgi:hypothetical protein